jgi:hypothetical protein
MQELEELLELSSSKQSGLGRDIRLLSGQMMHNLKELELMEQQADSESEKKYMTTYVAILRQISSEVLEAKLKYHNIDRERLIS